jgi:hypothetical protein
MSDSSKTGGRSLSPLPPKPRKRHRYSPDFWRDGENYLSWSPEWTDRGLVRHPSPDRCNRIAPWGYHDGKPVAPWGMSPVSGTPRLSPCTIGSMRNQALKKGPGREFANSIAAYSNAVAKTLSDSLESRVLALLGCDPFAALVDVIKDPKASRHEKMRASEIILPFLYPRKKSVSIESTKTSVKYVIEVPAEPSTPILDVTVKKDAPDE